MNPRFEAIDRTRHNLSLISNSNRLKSNSIVIHEKNNFIEYNLPKEPETNKNRKSIKKPSASCLAARDIINLPILDDEEFPEV